jgi:methyl-accepting chemotaxis protein
MFFANLSVKNKLLLVLLPISLVMFIGGVVIIYDLLESAFKDKNTAKMQSEIRYFNNSIHYHLKLAQEFATLFSSYDFVNEAYTKQNEDSAAAFLQNEITQIIKKLPDDAKKYQIHFHKPPAQSFVRSWTKKRGDDLSGFRQTIMEVYKTQKPITGIEFGIGGIAIRGIVPIFNKNNSYLGSVEYFYSTDDLLNLFSDQSQNSNSTFITLVKSDLVDKTFEKSVTEALYPTKFNGYYFAKTNVSWLNLNSLNNQDFVNILDSTNTINVFSMHKMTLGILPIYDFNNVKIGYYLFAENNIKEYETLNNKMIYFIVGLIFGFALLIGMFYLFILKLIIRPIIQATEKIRKVSEGIF